MIQNITGVMKKLSVDKKFFPTVYVIFCTVVVNSYMLQIKDNRVPRSLKQVKQNTYSARQKCDVTGQCIAIWCFQKFSTHIMDIKRQCLFGMSAVHVTFINQFNWIWKTLQKRDKKLVNTVTIHCSIKGRCLMLKELFKLH